MMNLLAAAAKASKSTANLDRAIRKSFTGRQVTGIMENGTPVTGTVSYCSNQGFNGIFVTVQTASGESRPVLAKKLRLVV